MHPKLVSSTLVAVLAALGAALAVERFFDNKRTPGSKFIFEKRFEGVYCLGISPEHPAAPIDAEGFSVYTFDSRGVARSSTFPAGKGAVNKAVSGDNHFNQILLIHSWSPCGTLSFGDRAILLGVVGSGSCPKYDIERPQSFDEALAFYCN